MPNFSRNILNSAGKCKVNNKSVTASANTQQRSSVMDLGEPKNILSIVNIYEWYWGSGGYYGTCNIRTEVSNDKTTWVNVFGTSSYQHRDNTYQQTTKVNIGKYRYVRVTGWSDREAYRVEANVTYIE